MNLINEDCIENKCTIDICLKKNEILKKSSLNINLLLVIVKKI